MIKKITTIAPLAVLALTVSACSGNKSQMTQSASAGKVNKPVTPQQKNKNYTVRTAIFKPRRAQKRGHGSASFTNKLSSAALGRLKHRVRYDGAYVKIGYPWGDVPANMGVCTDVVIRSYRKLGIDLQQQVHKDMNAAFEQYPNLTKWGLSRPDSNIDHRRVYNLQAFFKRRGAALPVTRNPRNYRPGDLVTWMVGPNMPHIGVVVNQRSKADPNRFMIVHNIARGPEMEDILFQFPITGHYRYTPAHMNTIPDGRMLVSNGTKSRPGSYNSLVQDAARLMKLHNVPVNTPPSAAKTSGGSTPKAIKTSSRSQSDGRLTLAQAKLGNYNAAKLTKLLK